MTDSEVRVPQMGEGLRTVKVAKLLKKIGEWVDEDCDVVEVETAKANIGVVAPTSGYVCDISCAEGEEVAVGSVLLTLSSAQPTSIVRSGNDNVQIRKGERISQAPLAKIPAVLSTKQTSLIRALEVSRDIVIPASIEVRVAWAAIDNSKQGARQAGHRVPSGIEIICWAVAQAMLEFEKFRCQINRAGDVIRHENSIVGIARRAGVDDLDVNVVEIDRQDNFLSSSIKVRAACKLPDYATGYHSLAISDMSCLGVISGQPLVVYPSIATLFIGAPHWCMTGPERAERVSNFVLAFDHRVINGAYAADFMQRLIHYLKTASRGEERAA